MKKMNSYVKLGIILLVSAVGGGILGVVTMLLLGNEADGIQNGAAAVLSQMQQMMLPFLIVILVLSVILGEWTHYRQRIICSRVLEAEDEECDRWEYEEERNGALGSIINILSQVLCILILSSGYSIKYIAEDHQNVMAACLVFLVCYVYDGFWQVRFVKTTQKAHPEKKGDPASLKFQQQWLESCDEAEKEVVFQSAYKCYFKMNRWIPALLLIAMLGHLFFDTGILAIIIVAVIWLILTGTYLRSCVDMKKEKIR